MKRTRRTNPISCDEDVQEQIIKAYVDEFFSVREIASWIHVSRQAVYKFLKKRGIKTTKRRFRVKCSWCEKDVWRPRSQIHGKKNIFCDMDCYYAWIKSFGPYNRCRHTARIARTVVSQWFDLEDGMVVHHEDKDQRNNLRWNLKVFKDNKDHLRYHRWGYKDVEPVWDGSVK